MTNDKIAMPGTDEMHKLRDDFMKQWGVSKETAITMVALTFESMLRHDTDEAAMAWYLTTCQEAAERSEPWAVEYLGAEITKAMPDWKAVYLVAKEKGHDPTTALSLHFSHSMDWADNVVKLIERGPGKPSGD